MFVINWEWISYLKNKLKIRFRVIKNFIICWEVSYINKWFNKLNCFNEVVY